jgi:hypothetical protein
MNIYQQAMDKLFDRSFDIGLHLFVFILLLFFQDKVSQFVVWFYNDCSSNEYFSSLFTRMFGLFQTSFYFGYMALFSAGIGIMCGKLIRMSIEVCSFFTII